MNNNDTNDSEKCLECGKPIKGIGVDAICLNDPNDKINQVFHTNCLLGKHKKAYIDKRTDGAKEFTIQQVIQKIRICPDCKEPMPPQVHHCEKCRKRRAKYSKKNRQRRWRKKQSVRRRKTEFSLQ
jgi:hypothetical protein